MIGTLFVNETPMEVERLHLGDGRFWVTASMEGSNLAEGLTDVRLHAPDGSLVLAARVDMPRAEVPLEHWSGRIVVELPMSIVGSQPGEEWATHPTTGRWA